MWYEYLFFRIFLLLAVKISMVFLRNGSFNIYVTIIFFDCKKYSFTKKLFWMFRPVVKWFDVLFPQSFIFHSVFDRLHWHLHRANMDGEDPTLIHMASIIRLWRWQCSLSKVLGKIKLCGKRTSTHFKNYYSSFVRYFGIL